MVHIASLSLIRSLHLSLPLLLDPFYSCAPLPSPAKSRRFELKACIARVKVIQPKSFLLFAWHSKVQEDVMQLWMLCDWAFSDFDSIGDFHAESLILVVWIDILHYSSGYNVHVGLLIGCKVIWRMASFPSQQKKKKKRKQSGKSLEWRRRLGRQGQGGGPVDGSLGVEAGT